MDRIPFADFQTTLNTLGYRLVERHTHFYLYADPNGQEWAVMVARDVHGNEVVGGCRQPGAVPDSYRD